MWSSSSGQPPRSAWRPVRLLLAACQPEIDPHRERVQLWIAGLLSFLVSFVQAFAMTLVTQVAAQAAIHDRLVALRGIPVADAGQDD